MTVFVYNITDADAHFNDRISIKPAATRTLESNTLNFITAIVSSQSSKQVIDAYNDNLSSQKPTWLESDFTKASLSDIQVVQIGLESTALQRYLDRGKFKRSRNWIDYAIFHCSCNTAWSSVLHLSSIMDPINCYTFGLFIICRDIYCNDSDGQKCQRCNAISRFYYWNYNDNCIFHYVAYSDGLVLYCHQEARSSKSKFINI